MTDEQIRRYRDGLPGSAVDERLICQVALGNRLPYEGVSREQARAAVERAIERGANVTDQPPSPPIAWCRECNGPCRFGSAKGRP